VLVTAELDRPVAGVLAGCLSFDQVGDLGQHHRVTGQQPAHRDS
jgi:hypothetical protein